MEESTVKEVGRQLRELEARLAANLELVLNELQRQGKEIAAQAGELAQLRSELASYHARLLEHDLWEREREAARVT